MLLMFPVQSFTMLLLAERIRAQLEWEKDPLMLGVIL